MPVESAFADGAIVPAANYALIRQGEFLYPLGWVGKIRLSNSGLETSVTKLKAAAASTYHAIYIGVAESEDELGGV